MLLDDTIFTPGGSDGEEGVLNLRYSFAPPRVGLPPA